MHNENFVNITLKQPGVFGAKLGRISTATLTFTDDPKYKEFVDRLADLA